MNTRNEALKQATQLRMENRITEEEYEVLVEGLVGTAPGAGGQRGPTGPGGRFREGGQIGRMGGYPETGQGESSGGYDPHGPCIEPPWAGLTAANTAAATDAASAAAAAAAGAAATAAAAPTVPYALRQWVARWFTHRQTPADFAAAAIYMALFIPAWAALCWGVNWYVVKMLHVFAQLGADAPLLAALVANLFNLSSPTGWILPLGAIAMAVIAACHPDRNRRWVSPGIFLLVLPALFYLSFFAMQIMMRQIPVIVGKGG